MSIIAATLNGQAVLTSAVAPQIGSVNIYDATTGVLSPTLPALSGLVDGSSMVVQKSAADTTTNAVTFTTTGGDTFQTGGTSRALARTGSMLILQVVTVSATKYWKETGYGAPESSLGFAEQLITLTGAYTLASQTAAQALFNSPANGQVTLSPGSYFFESFFTLSAMSASSGSFGFALGGTATRAGELWETEANKAALVTAASAQHTVNTAANATIATASTATAGWGRVAGKVRVSAAGTLIPQVSLGVAAAAIVGVDSYFRIWLVGSQSVQSVGNWS